MIGEDDQLTGVPQLTGRTVHVHAVRLQGPDEGIEPFRALLAPDETTRAGRFRFEHLQRSFILARASLRMLLGHYLDSPPGDIQFSYGAKGKPSLAVSARVQFNMSHSRDLAMFAFTLDCEIGVDVEAIRPMPDIDDIAKRFFSGDETAELMSLPADERARAFFLCWTRKEAYIKATGEGLSTPLGDFRVTLRPGEPARMLYLSNDPSAAQAWTLHDLAPDPGYAGALAYRDEPRPLEAFPVAAPGHLLEIM